MTVRAAVSQLRGRLKEVSGDTIYTNYFLWSVISSVKKLLFERDRYLVNYQDFFHIVSDEPEEVVSCDLDMSCLPERMFRIAIPNLIHLKLGHMIKRAGSSDSFTDYRIVSTGEFYKKSRLRGNKTIYAFPHGDYLYFSKYIPCITVEYLCDFKPGGCSHLDADACIPNDLEELIMRMCVESFGVNLSKPLDVIPNMNPNQ